MLVFINTHACIRCPQSPPGRFYRPSERHAREKALPFPMGLKHWVLHTAVPSSRLLCTVSLPFGQQHSDPCGEPGFTWDRREPKAHTSLCLLWLHDRVPLVKPGEPRTLLFLVAEQKRSLDWFIRLKEESKGYF